MKSFIKSHKRVPSGATGESLSPDPEPSEQRRSEDSSFPPSPNYPPTSPTKTNKLRGLFQRSRGSSQNLLSHTANLSPISPSRNTDSPSIIGTRTHEWGINPQRGPSVKPGRISFDSTLSSQSMDSLADLANSHTHPLKEELLQLPLNTVLEIPDKGINNSLVEIKNIHRRAQILTPDSLTNTGIEIPITPEKSDLDSFDDDLHTRKDLYPEVLDLSDNTEGRTPERPRAASPVKTNEGISAHSAQVVDEDEAYESDFSFEENERAGRNASIRYYKTQMEIQPQQYVREPGFYINDLIEDDDFDEDMNCFDEENDFNDDEELFNRKYFSDDDEESIPQQETNQKTFILPLTNEKASGYAPLSSAPLKQQSQQLLTIFNEKSSLQSKRSLKYHQLPTNLEQEYAINNRYSWISDDEDSLKTKPQGANDSYDSLLDEINGIPEDYDSHDDENSPPQQVKPKSKSLKSRNRSNLAYADSPLNTKFETGGRTVTLFNHPSRSNSVKNSQEVVPEQMRFRCINPISSFTGPNPGFISEKLAELSPISEGSIDGSP